MFQKFLLIALIIPSFSAYLYSQSGFIPHGGTILFATSPLNSALDARVTYSDGTPVGPEFTAQLLAGPEGTPLASLVPVIPTTTFYDTQPRLGYIRAKEVIAENVPLGGRATVVMLAYNGATWETSTYRGQSDPILVITGHETRPPGPLEGLKSFNVYAVPEPSIIAFVFLGIALFAFNAKLRSTK